MATNDARGDDQAHRDRYRDNDDVRNPIPADQRAETNADTKSEARGDAREARGDVARDTDTDPTGPEGNDNQKARPRRDDFDGDLERSRRDDT